MKKIKCMRCGEQKPKSHFERKDGKGLNGSCHQCIEKASRHSTGVRGSPSVMEILNRKNRPRIISTNTRDATVAAGQRVHLRVAVNDELGYIHASGQGYTSDRDHAWVGTKAQFERLCEKFGHDPAQFKLQRLVIMKAGAELKNPDAHF